MDKQAQTRRIRSFVRREGRLTRGQARALEQHWPRYGIDYSPERLDPGACFGRRSPLYMDIGCGNGDTTLALAAANPGHDYLAVEVYRPGVGNLLRRAAAEEIGNIRVICHDAVEVLRDQIPEACLDGVLILFPDPWPKKRHHKRRLVSTAFLELLLPRLKPQARLYLATDWEDLAVHMLEVCDTCPGLLNLAGNGNFAPRPLWRPPTRFEARGLAREHPVFDLIYCLNDAPERREGFKSVRS